MSGSLHTMRLKKDKALAVATLLAASVLVNLGKFHSQQNADGLLPVLVSLQKWTPYWWGVNRYGMLVPLLASPIEHPFWNKLAQGMLMTFFGLGTFFAIARFLLPGVASIVAGALGCIVFLAAMPSAIRVAYLASQVYAPTMFTMFAGLLLLRSGFHRRSWTGQSIGALSIFVSLWVNPVTAIIAGPMLALRRLLPANSAGGEIATAPAPLLLRLAPPRVLARRGAPTGEVRDAAFTWTAMLIVAIGFALSVFAASTVRDINNESSMIPISQFPHAWQMMWERSVRATGMGVFAALGLFIAAGAAALLLVRRQQAPAALAAIFICFFTALLCGAALAINGHIAETWSPRYSLPCLVLLVAGAMSFVTAAFLLPWPESWQRLASRISLIALLVTPLLVFGPPSPERVRHRINKKYGQHTKAIMKSGATHVIGRFWDVVPAVYHANLVRYERGSDRQIWGITQYSSATIDLWRGRDFDDAIIIGIGKRADINRHIRRFDLQLVQTGKIGALPIFRPRGSAGEPEAAAASQPATLPSPE